MNRRLNLSGKRPIPAESIEIELGEPGAERTVRIRVFIDKLRERFPQDSNMVLEAYRGAEESQRFELGTIDENKVAVLERDISLTGVLTEGIYVSFRFFLANSKAQLLGVRSRRVPKSEKPKPKRKEKYILRRVSEPLGDMPVKLTIDPHDGPTLHINSEIPGYAQMFGMGEANSRSEPVYGPVMVLVLTQIFQYLSRSDAQPEDDERWESEWYTFSQQLLETEPPTTPYEHTTTLWDEWIKNIVLAFCTREKVVDKAKRKLKSAGGQ